jgi:hypothetical protein
MEADARIRLEGRLEIVEQGTLEAIWALDGLKRNEWRGAARALDTKRADAVAAVRAMARVEPSLDRVLTRFERAHRRLGRAVAARAAARGLPVEPPRDQLRRLIEDDVLFEADLHTPMLGLAVPLYGVVLLMGVCLWPEHFGWIPPAVLAGFLATLSVLYGGTTTVLVTRDRLVVGRHVVRIADLRRVTTDSTYSPRPSVLWLETTSHVRRATLPWIPEQMIDALATRGVAIERHDWPYDSNRSSRLQS